MRGRTLALLVAVILGFGSWHLDSRGEGLPTFEDFRRADRERRATGQLNTAESLALARIDPKRIARVAAENHGDPELLLGLAELGGDWQAALDASRTNAAVALRFACARASKHDLETALRWFRYCQTNDTENIVPWLGEVWVLRQQGKPPDVLRLPARATVYRDYAVQAARTRVRTLEKAGYSPYAARRLGLMQNTFAESMAQDLSRGPVAGQTGAILLNVAHAMQQHPTFLLTEYVGQSLERKVLVPAAGQQQVEQRIEEMGARREQLEQLLMLTGRNAVEFATESEMVQYFDDVLTLGEERAMKRLAEAVRKKAVTP